MKYRKYLNNIIERYKITSEEIENIQNEDNMIYSLMQVIGKKRGALVQGGIIDDEKTARIILDDFRNCRLGRISLDLILYILQKVITNRRYIHTIRNNNMDVNLYLVVFNLCGYAVA